MADSDILWEVQEIKKHLDRMDKRDRLRTVGGFIKGTLQLIPLVLLLYCTWYFYKHSEEIITSIAEMAASKATEFTKMQFEGMKGDVQSGNNNEALINQVRKMLQSGEAQQNQ